MKIISSKYFLLLWWLLYSFLLMGSSDEYRFKQLTINSGLSSNTVYSILQDSKGYIWIGTSQGLNRYNGYEFTLFIHEQNNINSLTNDQVFSISEDSNNDIWIGTGEGLNKYNRATGNIERKIDHTNKDELKSIQIYSVFCDSKGNRWVGTNGSGLLLFKNQGNDYDIYPLKSGTKEIHDERIRTIFEDSKGNIWIGTKNSGLFKINLASGELVNFKHNTENKYSLSGNHIRSICEDVNNNLWIGTENNGVNILKNATTEFINANNNSKLGELGNKKVRSILNRVENEIWIGTLDGLYIYNVNDDTILLFNQDPNNEMSLTNNSIRTLCKDYQDNVWIGTYYGGINIFHESHAYFNSVTNESKNGRVLSNPIVSSIIALNDDLWVGTEGGGVNVFDRNKNIKEVLFNTPEYNNIKATINDGMGNIWIGTGGNGLIKYNYLSKKYVVYKNIIGDENSLSNNSVFSLFKDTQNNIWVGTNTGGLCKYNPENNNFIRINKKNGYVDISGINVFSITETENGLLCVGTNRGVSLYDIAKNVNLEIDKNSINNSLKLSHNVVSSLLVDANVLWIGTSGGGLNKYDLKSGGITYYNKNKDLSNAIIHGIVKDFNNKLWISTNNGIFVYNEEMDTFIQFDENDGLHIKTFHTGASLIDDHGQIYFGGTNGFVWFNPSIIKFNLFEAPVVITEIKEFNTPLKSEYFTKKSNTDALVLPHSIRGLTFEFAALNYISTARNTYAYKLENYFDEWVDIGNKHSVTFSLLPPGDYTLLIKASNNHGVWSAKTARFSIQVKPPTWKTWYAYLLYALVLLIILMLFRRYTLTWAKLKHELESEKLEAENIKKINHLKLSFFTNVSHEFRTPLTLIVNATSDLKAKLADSKNEQKTIQVLEKNSKKLLQLVTELMDFRKAESGMLTFRSVQLDIVSFIRNITDNFQEYAARQNVDISFISDTQTMSLWFDPPKMDKIIINLLSNALKHTDNAVMVSLNNTDSHFNIGIIDNGSGVSEKEKSLIFERFYQGTKDSRDLKGFSLGTGIGLALTKQLVELHSGTIEVNCKNNQTIFTVQIPIGDQHLTYEQKADPKNMNWEANDLSYMADDQKTTIHSNLTHHSFINKENMVLIVEDNKDLSEYLNEQFQQYFDVIRAWDGAEGIKKAKQNLPDLIISDIMMPNVSGIELCNDLKNDTLTSHIPILLLTARGTDESKIEGLQTGADAYIQKPFNLNILLAQCNNLLVNRELLRKKFAGTNIIETRNITTNKHDSIFLEKTIALVEDKMENPEFDVLSLCSELGMSRSVFYRKIKALTDLAPQEFIKNLRLRKAAYLLKEKDITIAEVATEVGFVNTKHFSTSFKKLYNHTPTNYRQTSDK